ncbi:MAG TPA: EF-P beta-lysylation protein EpmB, partial [Gammaproteobacteria bacterium]
MIHAKPRAIQESGWQRTLREAVADAATLRAALGLPAEPAGGPATGFPVRVPAPYLARIRHGDPDDPLLRQVLPSADEAVTAPGFC